MPRPARSGCSRRRCSERPCGEPLPIHDPVVRGQETVGAVVRNGNRIGREGDVEEGAGHHETLTQLVLDKDAVASAHHDHAGRSRPELRAQQAARGRGRNRAQR